MDYQLVTLLGMVAAIITIVGAIYAALRWGGGLVHKLWHAVSRYKPKVPRETVRVLPQVGSCWWGEGKVGDRPAMQVVGGWHVTNITGNPVRLLAARISRPRTEGYLLARHPEENVYGSYPILPGQTTEVSSDFWVIPPVRKVGEDFKATVILTDQYGNEHKIKNVAFKGPRPKETEKKGPPIEAAHSILDPLEKQVVSVLKAEGNRYKACGRRVGGLGSIQTKIRDRIYIGLGTEWREAGSPKNQSIQLDEGEVLISSDTAEALLNLHAALSGDAEKQAFYDALLKRLDKRTEYAPVGYLMLFVLLQLDMLKAALDKAKSDLRGDGAYGFSDFLRFLDGLLRFRHTSFSSEMLDDVERFLEGIDEHTFKIQERVAAIRAHRL